MIEQNVEIHDRHQIEIKIAYKLDEFARVEDLALYLFLPASLGIGSDTYTKHDFFSALVDYIRLKTPTVLLRDLGAGPDSPLGRLAAAIASLSRSPGAAGAAAFDRQLRMYCCILKSSLRDHVALLSTRGAAGDRQDIIERFLGHVDDACREFRALRTQLNVQTITPDDFGKFLHADEFVSLTVEFYAYALLEALRAADPDLGAALQPRLLGLIGREIAYRRANGYPSIPDARGDNENLLFRKGVLKKFVESVLFLTTHNRREGALAEQTVFALAAGISMVFATGIAFLFQRLYGNLTFPFFMALVVSYMFKDRLKAALHSAMSARVSRFFFDRRQNVYDDSRATNRIGTVRENFDFLPEERLPAEIRRLRARDHITALENGGLGETVLLYRKQIRLLPQWFHRARAGSQIEGINEILRINVAQFLQRMDDPRKPLWVCDETSYRQVEGRRVYHINLIVQSRSRETTEQLRYRLVVDKDGLKRIEPLNPLQPASGPRPRQDEDAF